MNATNLLIAAASHIVVFSIALPVIMRVKPDSPELALGVAAITGTWIAALLNHRCRSIPASLLAKAALGGEMAMLCIIECLVVQWQWHIFAMPEVIIPVSAVGTFGFPFVLFGIFERSFKRTA